MSKTEKNIKTIKTVLVVFLVLALLAISKVTGEVSTRILMALFIFVMVLPLTTALEKIKCPKWLATVIAVLVIVFALLFFVWFIFFTVDVLIKKVPDYSSRINDLDGLLKSIVSRWIDIPDDVTFLSTLNIDWVGGVIMPTLRSVSSSTLNILRDVLVILLMTSFLLMERHTLIPKLSNFVQSSDSQEEKASGLWGRIVRQVSKYITLKVFVSVITGILFYLVSVFVGLDFAFLWGVLAVILNFIPTIGSIIITVLVILMAVVQFAPNIVPIVIVAVSALVIQTVVGNFIDPKLSGTSLNLSPFVILVSLSVFGYIWGVVGMFLAVPLLSIVQIICANFEETRPIAMAISSGRSFRRESAKVQKKKAMSFKNVIYRKDNRQFKDDDYMFPDRQ